MRPRTNRRENNRQREAVARVLSSASGVPSVMRVPDGSVLVYDEHRDWEPPTTLRTRVTRDGHAEAPDRLRL
jgi:hypothetical protein